MPLSPSDGAMAMQFGGHGLAISGVLIAFRTLPGSPPNSTHLTPISGPAIVADRGLSCRPPLAARAALPRFNRRRKKFGLRKNSGRGLKVADEAGEKLLQFFLRSFVGHLAVGVEHASRAGYEQTPAEPRLRFERAKHR